MKTVIFKWNPSFSSYSMFHFLRNIVELNFDEMEDYNWSVWDFDQIHEGDRYYWMKLGPGQVGLVGAGTITSEPYESEDWSGKGRRTFYVDFEPEIMINPDAMPILNAQILNARIPDFEWDHGHSGLVLTESQAEELDKLWKAYIEEHEAELEKKSERTQMENDLVYWNK